MSFYTLVVSPMARYKLANSVKESVLLIKNCESVYIIGTVKDNMSIYMHNF